MGMGSGGLGNGICKRCGGGVRKVGMLIWVGLGWCDMGECGIKWGIVVSKNGKNNVLILQLLPCVV